jgi:RHS repeat-associated protein
MQLASGTHIPDGLLAANALLSEKLHQGSATSTRTLHQSFGVVISHTPLGISRSLYDGRARCRYTGKERDTESGLDNFGPRYYASSMGRFMSPDDVGGHLEDPQTLNLYSYVGNNPLSRTDPSGHDFWQSCGTASATCGNQVIGKGTDGKNVTQLVSGTTDKNGTFSATVITSASLGQAGSGNSATVNGSGLTVTTGTGTSSQQSGQGIFIANTPAANIQGQGAGWNQFNFHIDGNDIAHGVLSSGEATYNGAGGRQGMMDTLNNMKAGNNGPWNFPGEDYYNYHHPDAHNMRYSTGDHPVLENYGPSPHFPVPRSGTVSDFHVDNGTGPGHLSCAQTGSCY